MRIVFPDEKPWCIQPVRIKKGEHWRKAVSEEFSRHLLRLYRAGATYKELAIRYGIGQSRTWDKVQDAIDEEEAAI